MERGAAQIAIDAQTTERLTAALDRILASENFSAGPRGRQLLEHVVREESAGRGELIKGYTLGVEVLGRAPDFDPQSDSIVRVEMGRLRKALELFYATEGAEDPARIVIPTGNYRPRVEMRAVAEEPARKSAAAPAPPSNAAPSSSARWGWRMAAAALIVVGGAAAGWRWATTPAEAPRPAEMALAAAQSPAMLLPQLSLRVETPDDETGLVIARIFRSMLSRFDQIQVVADIAQGEAATAAADAEPVVAAPQAYELVISAAAPEGELPMSASVRHVASNAVIWDVDLPPADEITDSADHGYAALQQIAGRLGGGRGVLYGHYRTLEVPNPLMRCIFVALDTFADTPASPRDAASECLEAEAADGPSTPLAHALRARLLLADLAEIDDAEARAATSQAAYDAARKALDLGPDSAVANVAMMRALAARGDQEEAKPLALKALEFNSNDPHVLASVGAHFVEAGRHAEARTLLDLAYQIAPAGEPRWALASFFAAFAMADWEVAARHADTLANWDAPAGRAIRAAAAGRFGAREDDAPDGPTPAELAAEAIAEDPSLLEPEAKRWERLGADAVAAERLRATLSVLASDGE